MQDWTSDLTLMQQSVLLTSIRGPDGTPKYSGVKLLLRWLRRCVLKSAMDGRVLTNPYDSNGGSFTGPSIKTPEPQSEAAVNWYKPMDEVVDGYMKTTDGLPHHFQTHLMHAAEILGYKHPDPVISLWWNGLYKRLVSSLHLHPESMHEMDYRLGDTRQGWLERADKATVL